MPTIRDVAQYAQVSVATVSRVLNGLDGYSEDTKQRVLQAIRETGFHPNAVARSLSNRRTRTIGVLLPNVADAFSGALLYGVEAYAHSRQYCVLICNTAEDGRRTMSGLQVLREKQVDGILFASEALLDEYRQALLQMKVPAVLIATESSDPRFPSVKVNDRQAAYDAVCHLIGCGHREIAMIAGTARDPIAGVPRLDGYRQALADNGLPFRQERVAFGDFFFDSGAAAMEQLLGQAPGFTALFAASDEMAAGAMGCAASRGLRIPGDLSIIGYDDLKLARMIQPPLTTVRQPLAAMGQEACARLLGMIEAGGTAASCVMAHSIIERQTVRFLPRDGGGDGR